jgi:hypothetical protein
MYASADASESRQQFSDALAARLKDRSQAEEPTLDLQVTVLGMDVEFCARREDWRGVLTSQLRDWVVDLVEELEEDDIEGLSPRSEAQDNRDPSDQPEPSELPSTHKLGEEAE